MAKSDPVYSHHVWRRYASPVWMDINQSRTLNREGAREEKDERHICPLQLDVIERGIELYTNPGDVVFTPFLGIGSEVYQAVKMGRKAIGIELKKVISCKLLKIAEWRSLKNLKSVCLKGADTNARKAYSFQPVHGYKRDRFSRRMGGI